MYRKLWSDLAAAWSAGPVPSPLRLFAQRRYIAFNKLISAPRDLDWKHTAPAQNSSPAMQDYIYGEVKVNV